MSTAIEWTDDSWNPVVGCTKVAPECANCYAERIHTMRHKAYLQGKPIPSCYAHPFDKVVFLPERLDRPRHWQKPKKVFVGSMTDLFHEQVKTGWLDQIFAIMAMTPHITYQLLTKRPARMREYLSDLTLPQRVNKAAAEIDDVLGLQGGVFPLRNVWVGVTPTKDEDITTLLDTPAAIRFVSIEPIIRSWDLAPYLGAVDCQDIGLDHLYNRDGYGCWIDGLDWVICGGETGPNRRYINSYWVSHLRNQCVANGVPFFFKKWGTRRGDPADHMVDGLTWEQFPEEAR